MSKTRRRAPRVGRTPDLLRKSHVHPRRYAEPEVDPLEVDEALRNARIVIREMPPDERRTYIRRFGQEADRE